MSSFILTEHPKKVIKNCTMSGHFYVAKHDFPKCHPKTLSVNIHNLEHLSVGVGGWVQRSPLHCHWSVVFNKAYHVGVNMICFVWFG